MPDIGSYMPRGDHTRGHVFTSNGALCFPSHFHRLEVVFYGGGKITRKLTKNRNEILLSVGEVSFPWPKLSLSSSSLSCFDCFQTIPKIPKARSFSCFLDWDFPSETLVSSGCVKMWLWDSLLNWLRR